VLGISSPAPSADQRDVLLHDFRRSAVMNMVQAGVDRKVIREYTGHATDNMHDRYHILRNEQVVEAARMNEQRKLRERELYAQKQTSSGPKLGQSQIVSVSDSLDVVVN
jgi:hypothetical protein